MNNNKYTIEEIKARTSQATLQGMSLKIDDLAAIGRVLSIQDDAYDEQFDSIYKSLKAQQEINGEILSSLKGLKIDIADLKTKVNGLESKIEELTRTINSTRDNVHDLDVRVECLDKDVQRLKRINSPWFYVGRIVVGVAIGIILVGLIFGLF